MRHVDKSEETIAAHIDATIHGAATDIANTSPGNQANVLYQKSAHVGSVIGQYDRPGLVDKALDAMTGAALEMPASGKPWTKQEAQKQIQNGLQKGLSNPAVGNREAQSYGLNRQQRRKQKSLNRQEPPNPGQPDFPIRTKPVNGKPLFIVGADLPPQKDELRRHYYHRADRQPVAIKVMRSKEHDNRAANFYRVIDPSTKKPGWQAAKPNDYQFVPYNLTGFTDPELSGEPLLFVEGERDCETLINHGAGNATTYGSSGSLGDDCKQYFAGRNVFVIGDNDKAGNNHVAGISRRLQGIAASTKGFVTSTCPDGTPAPEGFDITDYFEAGGTLSRFLDLVDKAPDTVPVDDPVVPQSAAAEVWTDPEPIQSSLPDVMAFVPEMLPEALRGYVFDVAERQQSAPDFVAVSALCGIAAIVGNRVRIAPKQHDCEWIVVPNLWGMIVGRPSAVKTPSMKAALAPLYKIEKELKSIWDDEIKAAQTDNLISALTVKESEKKAREAIRNEQEKEAREILAGIMKGEDTGPPTCARLVVNDSTVEKLGELLFENPRGLLLIRDELPGLLARLEREEFQTERTFYLSASSGDNPYTFDRIGRGTIRVENCTLSIIGGVQPSRIAPIVRGALTGASNDGFIQRLQLTVWPDETKGWKWIDRHTPREFRETYEQCFNDLHEMEFGNTDHPTIMRFSATAQDLFQQWMERIQADARVGDLPSALESHVLKMPDTIATLALLFELIDGGRFDVGEKSMRRAMHWSDFLRSHANRLYASGDSVIEDGARLIIQRRDRLKNGFTARKIHKSDWAGLTDLDTVNAAIELLVETHHCREMPRANNQSGGRPSTAYEWNPALPLAKSKAKSGPADH